MVTSPEIIEAEEYAVYSILIESWYVNNDTGLIVIEDTSGLDLWDEDLEKRLQVLTEVLSDVPEEMKDVFRQRNMQPVPFKPVLSLTVPYVFVDWEQRNGRHLSG